MKRFKRILMHSSGVKWIIRFLQSKSFPAYNEVTWYSVIEFFVRWVDTRDLHIRASSLAYTFFLALFPSAIFIFTLIAYLPFQNAHNDILLFFEGILPQSAYAAIKSTLLDILKKQHSGLLSIGFLSAVYFSTNGFVSLMKALNRFGMQKEKRSYWKQRLVALILALVVSFSFFLSILLVTAGNFIIKEIGKLSALPAGFISFMLGSLNYLIVAFIVLTIVSTVYYLAPAQRRIRKWRFITPGSVFACIIILLTTIGFSYYVNQFNSYNKVYGSIGVIIVVMLLIYINTYILLLGYEFNLAIDKTVGEIRKHGVVKANKVIQLKNFIVEEPEE